MADNTYDPTTEAVLTAIMGCERTELFPGVCGSLFDDSSALLKLAMALIDQAGESLQTQRRVAELLDVDELLDLSAAADDIGLDALVSRLGPAPRR
jgi:hypothetical protein